MHACVHARRLDRYTCTFASVLPLHNLDLDPLAFGCCCCLSFGCFARLCFCCVGLLRFGSLSPGFVPSLSCPPPRLVLWCLLIPAVSCCQCISAQIEQNGTMARCTLTSYHGSPTLVTSATIALLKPILWHFCLCGTSWGAESSR